jgi:hypothetical protein
MDSAFRHSYEQEMITGQRIIEILKDGEQHEWVLN